MVKFPNQSQQNVVAGLMNHTVSSQSTTLLLKQRNRRSFGETQMLVQVASRIFACVLEGTFWVWRHLQSLSLHFREAEQKLAPDRIEVDWRGKNSSGHKLGMVCPSMQCNATRLLMSVSWTIFVRVWPFFVGGQIKLCFTAPPDYTGLSLV